MSRSSFHVLLLVPALLLGLVGCATQGERSVRGDARLWETPTFISAHPDVHQRKRGIWLMDTGDVDAAVEAFTTAARYADKPSQAILAELHWSGTGTPRDRARAYAWMDLAAERGYAMFLGKRETYWESLTADERTEALRIGSDLYAEFGDAVAKPRMETLLRRTRATLTGSRVGFVGGLTVAAPTRAGWLTFAGHEFYDDRYWRPVKYFEWTDRLWRDMPGRGNVTVDEPAPMQPSAEG